MSADWRLEELGTIVTGKTPPKAVDGAFSESGVPFLTPKDMDGRKWIAETERYLSDAGVKSVKKSVIPAGSVAVSCIGSDMGKVVMVPETTVTNQQINTIIPDTTKCEPEYLYYLLSTMQQSLKDIAGGSATPILNKGQFGKVIVELPALHRQKSVARMLGTLDDKIQLNHQINQTLEQMAQAIFKSWFVDFEPVKAKIAALDEGGSEKDALLAAMQAISGKDADQLARMQAEQPEQYAELRATAELFPSAMQPSELGDIPEGWEVVQVGDILQRLKPPKRYTKKQVLPSGKVPVFEQGSSILLGFHDNDPGFKASAKDPIFIFGDHTCITHLSCQDFDISQNVIPLKGNIRPTIWTYYAILGKQTFQEYRRHWSEFIIKPVILPSMALCQQFTTCITDSLLLMESLERENKQLENIRDTLLPKLLSGEITVPEAEAQLATTGEVQA